MKIGMAMKVKQAHGAPICSTDLGGVPGRSPAGAGAGASNNEVAESIRNMWIIEDAELGELYDMRGIYALRLLREIISGFEKLEKEAHELPILPVEWENRDRLPGAICNLLNLQTLNLNGCRSLQKLPKGIGKLIKLRHLEILWTASLTYLPKGIACLTSLRTLSRFIGNSLVGSKACNIADLEKLNNIQGNITIDGLGAETDASEAERAGLENKNGLHGLELWFTAPGAGTNDERVLGALKAPSELKDLGIFYYRGELFPAWMITLQKLTHLTLADCDKCSVVPRLGELTSLESLKIMNMPSIKRVMDSEFLGAGSTDAFPKLEKISFENLSNWEEWVGLADDCDQANFMPMLSSLSIVNCRKLMAIPDCIKLKKNEKPWFHINIKKCPSLDQSQYE
ncbi:hypothetical protein PIB30_033521 [Stylosanthes scabra]|uniref:R13L1/DRL21-like LRR repeat region domain-containing protein n=1 Tax=Stylosanthes scabra TaxID=79078 RepID=A0ABU6RCZ6_9FABA|nr:hypothetical protein [Stylosanthes scabra]